MPFAFRTRGVEAVRAWRSRLLIDAQLNAVIAGAGRLEVRMRRRAGTDGGEQCDENEQANAFHGVDSLVG